MREISSGIFTWPWFSAPHGYNFNGYLVEDQGGNICVDPVEPDADTLSEITRRGAARIILTNRNHMRASNASVPRPARAPRSIPTTPPTRSARAPNLTMNCAPARKLVRSPWVAVAGKSPGEVALHWPEHRILIVGDAVIGNPPGSCSLLRERVLDDPPRLRNSVRDLLALDFDTLLVGDGESILTDAKRKLRELVASFT